MSGPQLIEHLRSARPDLRVLLMSGYTPGEPQTGGGLNGGKSTVPRLRKPFTMPDLTRALELVPDHAGLDHAGLDQGVIQQPVN